jgi:hypothetical protein
MGLDFFEKEVLDYYDMQLYSTIYMGKSQKEFNVIFDTGSSWLWVSSDKCYSCPWPNKIDLDEARKINDDIIYMSYISGLVTGYQYET